MQNLPKDLVHKVLSKVRLSSHGVVKETSVAFRKFITTGEVYNVRSRDNVAETCVHLALKSKSSGRLEWYCLFQTAHKKEYVLHLVPFPQIPVEDYCLVTCARRVYFIAGRYISDYIARRTNNVYCVEPGRYRRLHPDTEMKVERHHPKIAVIKDKIYVFGGCKETDEFAEFYDVKAKKWDTLTLPKQDRIIPWLCDTVVLGDQAFFITKSCHQMYIFDAKTGRLQRRDEEAFGDKMFSTSCVIEDTLFAFGETYHIESFDYTSKTWTLVKGLETLPPFDIFQSPQLLSFNGNLLLLHQPTQMDIGFIMIMLERRGQEFFGRIDSSNIGLTLQQPATIQELFTVEI